MIFFLYLFFSFYLFSNDDVPVAFDVTQLAAVEVHQQLPEARVGGREVDLGLGFFSGTYSRAQPAEQTLSYYTWAGKHEVKQMAVDAALGGSRFNQSGEVSVGHSGERLQSYTSSIPMTEN